MRRLLDRRPATLAAALFQRPNWRALNGFIRYVRPPVVSLVRYVTQRGTYPANVTVKTPCGRRQVLLYSRHDMLTLSEIFCRRDYEPCPGRLFVDVGANIGLASLYFLTRNPNSKVIGYEPNPLNAERYRENLRGFEARYDLHEAALAVTAGRVRFRVEPTGRYGRIDADGELEVESLGISQEIGAIVEREGVIDLVKIDTEGTEPELVAALPRDGTVRQVCWEDVHGVLRTTLALSPAVPSGHEGGLRQP